jgi:hypothetical protein
MEYKCHKCVKLYKSYKSLWNHNKNFHNPKITHDNPQIHNSITPIITLDNLSKSKLNLECKYCKKIFAYNQGRWRHEKICKSKEEVELKNTQIIKNNSSINNSSINNGSINNGTIINKNIIKFGSEDIKNILTEKQIEKIVNCRLLALEESIRQVHFNKDKPEYQNIKINNLRSNVALIHDGERFNVTNQYSAISSLIDNHVESIEQILDDKKTSLPIRTVEKLEMLISKLENNYKKIIDEESNRSFKNYKDYKVDTVKQMIYNKSRELDDLDKIKP